MSISIESSTIILNLRLPILLFIIGLGGNIVFTFFLIGTITSPTSDGLWWVYILYSILITIGFALVIAYLNCRIYAYHDYFVVKTFLGIKHKVQYASVTRIQWSEREVRIFTKDKHYSYIPVEGLDKFFEIMTENWPVIPNDT